MSIKVGGHERTCEGHLGEVGRYPPPKPHVSPDPAEQLRREIVSDPLNARLPAPHTPSYQDALAELCLRDRDSFRLPPAGLSFHCEVCDSADVILGRRRRWAVWVSWARIAPGADDFEDVVIPLIDWPYGDRGSAEDFADHLPRLRFERQADGTQLIYRLTLACSRCVRRDSEGAGLLRCRDEEANSAGEWSRCRRIAVTHDYCQKHGRVGVARERERYARTVELGVVPERGHRRAETDEPLVRASASDRGKLRAQQQLKSWGPERFAGQRSA